MSHADGLPGSSRFACRDSREQPRVPIPEVAAFIAEKIDGATSAWI